MKPSMSDVSEMVLDYLSHPENGVGGSLHIVLDDGNTDNDSVAYCRKYAAEVGDDAGVRLADALALLTEEDRDALYANRWRVPGSPTEDDDIRALAAGRDDETFDMLDVMIGVIGERREGK